MIRLALVSRPLAETDMRLASQVGVTDIVTTLPGTPLYPERVQGAAWDYWSLVHLRQQVEDAGLRLSVIEGYQLSDRITWGCPAGTKTWTGSARRYTI